MTTEVFCQRLQRLGWKLLEISQRSNGSWYAIAVSCDHTILASAATRHEAWRSICSIAMELTLEEIETT